MLRLFREGNLVFDLKTPEDLSLLRESVDLECKLAQGQNEQGEIPRDFWPTLEMNWGVVSPAF